MSDLFCSCGSASPNLGQPGCIDAFSRDLRLIFVQIRANDGSFNEIKPSDFVAGILPDAFVTGKINSTDDSTKWNITEVLKEPTAVRDEPVTQDIEGVGNIVRQGNLNYTATFYGGIAAPLYSTKLNGYSCKEVGFFSVDVAGNIKGKEVDDGTGTKVLRPRRIERNTLNATFNEPTADQLQSIMLKFTVGQQEIDGCLSFIPASAIATDMKEVPGVKDVTITTSNITATTIDFNLVFEYGPYNDKIPHKGVLDADIILFNETTALPVAMAVVENDEDGNYTGTFAAQTATDVGNLTMDQDGYAGKSADFAFV